MYADSLSKEHADLKEGYTTCLVQPLKWHEFDLWNACKKGTRSSPRDAEGRFLRPAKPEMGQQSSRKKAWAFLNWHRQTPTEILNSVCWETLYHKDFLRRPHVKASTLYIMKTSHSYTCYLYKASSTICNYVGACRKLVISLSKYSFYTFHLIIFFLFNVNTIVLKPQHGLFVSHV